MSHRDDDHDGVADGYRYRRSSHGIEDVGHSVWPLLVDQASAPAGAVSGTAAPLNSVSAFMSRETMPAHMRAAGGGARA